MDELLIDLYLNQRVSQVEATAEAAKDTAKQLRHEINDLKRKCDALTITSQALWEILRNKAGMTDAMILEKMQEIDLRDGRADGKISGRVVRCPRCGRSSNANRKLCLYCGTSMPVGNVFEIV